MKFIQNRWQLLLISTVLVILLTSADLPDAPWKALAIISSFDSFPKVIEGQALR